MKPTVYKFWEILPLIREGKFAQCGVIYRWKDGALRFWDRVCNGKGQWVVTTNGLNDLVDLEFTLAEDPEAPKWLVADAKELWTIAHKAIKEGNEKFQFRPVFSNGNKGITFFLHELQYLCAVQVIASQGHTQFEYQV